MDSCLAAGRPPWVSSPLTPCYLQVLVQLPAARTHRPASRTSRSPLEDLAFLKLREGSQRLVLFVLSLAGTVRPRP